MKPWLSLAGAALVAGAVSGPAAGAGPSAAAAMAGCDDAAVSGHATLHERASEEGVKVVDITLVMSGLADGKHAVHIHETASCTPCGAAKGHFDPGPHGQSSPDGNHPYHAGDLVNIEIRNGYGAMTTSSSRISLSPGPLGLFDGDGSAIIVHVDPDTYCPDGEQKGCAGGGRAACGVLRPL